MADLFAPLEPGPDPLPEAFPSPFDPLGPHPLARRAAARLQAELAQGTVETGGEGKMFGALVVRAPSGELGFLRGFSGMLAGRWAVPGFVPPAFDPALRAAVEVPGEAEVSALTARCRAFEDSPQRRSLVARMEALLASQEAERADLSERHRANREDRRRRRAAVLADAALGSDATAAALHALDQESRRDKAERRRLLEAQEAARKALEQERARSDRRLRALQRLRAFTSRRLMQRIHDAYRIANARGEVCSLRSLYASAEPPSGAGDCAGPKLLAAAFAMGLEPLALAEFWWGPPPPTGGRLQGELYPACKEKCGPLLPFMLQGLEVAPPRRFLPPDLRREPLRIVFEDAWLVVIDKPAGLLSIPGKEPVGDSVLERLRERHPGATGPLLVHRLDLDTSGLIVACLDALAHAALQKQFLARTVEKRYVAVLEGEPAARSGRIELPIRVDLQDRPRQIHDPVHGKRALTDWELLEQEGGRARVAFFPRTGRTHQLRVHAAHPLGLNAPIAGDRIYGRPGPRLLLHAERLAFRHPITGEYVAFVSTAPF